MKNIYESIILLLAVSAFTLQAGTIEGTVKVDKKIPERIVQRYEKKKIDLENVLKPVPSVAMIIDAENLKSAKIPEKNPKIKQKNFSFHPNLLIVPKGTTVDFPNMDLEFHNVFSYSQAKRFDLGRYPHGESKSIKFDKPGMVKIYCEVHDWMQAVVVVAENPYYSKIDENGKFKIPDVPAGKYTLLLWDLQKERKEIKINVPEEGNVTVKEEL